MGKRLLVVSMSLGGGHGRAGQCVASAVEAVAPDWEVRCVDLRDYAAGWFRALYVGGYLFLIRRIPWLFGLLYRHPRRAGGTLPPWVVRWALRPYEELVREYRPDAILATQVTASEATALLRRRGVYRGATATVLTDYIAMRAWRTPGIDVFFVPDELIARRFAELGIAGECLEPTGVPVAPAFEEHLDAEALRAKHGVRPGDPAVLLMGGSLGLGAIEAVVRDVVALGRRLDLIVVTGRNERLRRRLQALRAHGPARLLVLGFVDYVPELMALADLFVSKPGGLSVSEALTAGVPILVVRPLAGHEQDNARHLEAQGVIGRPAPGESPGAAIGRLLDDPGERRRLAAAARAYARRGTARRIATRLIEWTIRRAAEGPPP